MALKMETWMSGILEHENGRCSLATQTTNCACLKTVTSAKLEKDPLCGSYMNFLNGVVEEIS